jgi:hypothetical protein
MRFIFKAVGVFIIISAAISTIYAIAQQVNFFVALLAGIYGVGQSKCPYCGAEEKTDEICYND